MDTIFTVFAIMLNDKALKELCWVVCDCKLIQLNV